MLSEYKKAHSKATIQYLVIDQEGIVLESDDALFSLDVNINIATLHPFFESLLSVLSLPNEPNFFACVHLDINGKSLITDITIKTFANNKQSLLIIQDLTSHYNNYQIAAQGRNESVINSEILELKNKYLKEKEEFKNKFITNFSHDLRNPITGIVTFCSMLKNTNLTVEQQDYVNVIESSSDYTKNMIDDIIDISKIEVGKLDFNEQEFDLHALLEDLTFIYRLKAKQKGLDFHFDFDKNIPQFYIADKLRIKQVLNNLLDNAIKFTNRGGVTLKVSLNQIRAKRASINFQIIDTGIGIQKDHHDNIFKSFIQVHDVYKDQGTGLGLAIVKQLVDLMKGNITLDSETNSGTTFTANISFKTADSKKETKKPKEVTENKIKPSRKYNILLVEDSKLIQMSVLKILAKDGNFFLDILERGDDVIPTITNNNIDLILMDIQISGFSGIEIAQSIRSLDSKEHKKTPILALTGDVTKEHLKQYKKAGFNAVIKKPFDQESLLSTISKHLK